MRGFSGTQVSFVLLVCCLCLAKCCCCCNTITKEPEDPDSCTLFQEVGPNDLTPIEVFVGDKESKVVCIRARFSLSIKVEELLDLPPDAGDGGGSDSDIEPIVNLGYLQLDRMKSVEDNCPEMVVSADGSEANYPDELRMVVTFQCGKLTFNFKKDESYYVSSIKGSVILGDNSSIEAEFVSEQPMFLTSDLSHYFRFNDLIEVRSSVKTEKLQLTANFYNTEIEAFRNTNNRAFVRQADEESRPFMT